MNDLEQQKIMDVFSDVYSSSAIRFISAIPAIESLLESGQHIERIEIVLAHQKPEALNINIKPAKFGVES